MVQSLPQGKNAYLVVSDLHLHYQNKENRYSYQQEVESNLEILEKKILQLGEEGYTVYLIFLGDIFDRGYVIVDEALRAQSMMYKLSSLVQQIYVVVGNHEFTYSKNNPFWSLIKSIDSPRVQNRGGRSWVTKGQYNCFIIPDKLVDGDVEFIFNHHGCPTLEPDETKYTIGLFHQDVVFKSILEEAKAENRELFEMAEDKVMNLKNVTILDKTNPFVGYDLLFLAHMHLLYGKWEDSDIDLTLWYLASLGRTNHREVQNSFLERTIPIVKVLDGHLETIDSYTFNLPSREECVKEDVVKIQQESYQIVKEKKEIRCYNGTSDDPISDLRMQFAGLPEGVILESLLTSDRDSYYESVVNRMKEM